MNFNLDLSQSIATGDIIMLDGKGNPHAEAMDIDETDVSQMPNPNHTRQRKGSFEMSKSGALVVQSNHGPLKIHHNKGILDKTQAKISILEKKSQNSKVSYNKKLASETSITNLLKDLSELKILDTLGSGVSGTVHKCLHKPTNTIIATKTININDKKKRSQFKDEIELLLSYNHPNIVSFKGVTIDSNHCQVVIGLEFMENGSLDSVVSKYGALNENACKSIAKNIINALVFLEKHRIVHRDIKPANILLNKKWIAKLADFGIVKSLEKTQSNTIMAKTQIGTMAYMSPERLMGQDYSYNSDVWSVALTLMYCALAKFPYKIKDGEGPMILLATILESEPPQLPQKNNQFSINFRSFLKACLNKDRTKRWKASDLSLHPFIA